MTNPISSEDIDLVLRAIQQSSRPINVTNLKKAISKSAQINEPKLKGLLNSLVERGEIRVHRARQTVYWTPSLEEQASERILDTLEVDPLTKTELENRFRSLLLGWPLSKRKVLLERLIKERRIYKVKALTGNTKLLSVRSELTEQDYVRLALRLVVSKLAAKGVTEEQVFTVAREVLQPGPISSTPSKPATPTPSPDALGRLILERMTMLSPGAAQGAPVSISELRFALNPQIPDKDQFDQAILRLAETSQVALQRHTIPNSLSPQERDALVADSNGNFFTVIAIRI